MTHEDATTSTFEAALLRPALPAGEAQWGFVLLPKAASAKLPRRGRTTVVGSVNGQPFQVTLEPDGQKSHWLRIDPALQEAAGLQFGETAHYQIAAVKQEPEPELPADLQSALNAAPEALAVWRGTTTIARVDWIHWIVTAKQASTRVKRIRDACEMLASGSQRVCCFDPSGFYSKAITAPTQQKD
ncbi:DUF1905 domain-containing protein [Diaphorobacter sp. HDW4B]|uniref:YdeI/OmpD-associated family protein n=1 Tax=Diaphorobacter sp. HDW4B TaxID=2714925 RepID=UPI001409B763|nr:YdeI/OmpD-associated family protein [Diaphorobacter sp. HDW4B]QIL72434.1 DUF1905 domain-containing protein [Diaphorobacter sp. HDW4B]